MAIVHPSAPIGFRAYRLSKDPPDKVAILKKHNRAMKDPAAFRENNLYVGGVLLVGEVLR